MKASESWRLNLNCMIVIAVTKICDLKWWGRDNSSLVTRRIVFSWNGCLEICKYNLRRVTSLCFFSEGISGISRKSRYPRNSRGSSKFLFHSYNLKITNSLLIFIVCHWEWRCGDWKGLKEWHEVRGHPWVNRFGTHTALGLVGRLKMRLQI